MQDNLDIDYNVSGLPNLNIKMSQPRKGDNFPLEDPNAVFGHAISKADVKRYSEELSVVVFFAKLSKQLKAIKLASAGQGVTLDKNAERKLLEDQLRHIIAVASKLARPNLPRHLHVVKNLLHAVYGCARGPRVTLLQGLRSAVGSD